MRWMFLVLFWACKPAAVPAEASLEPPEPMQLKPNQDNLLFGYLDPLTQQFASTASVGAIPEAALGQVIVTDLTKSPAERQAGRFVQIADLRAVRPDGTYPVAVASRFGFEAKLTGTSTVTGARSQVVIYSASWCGVCKKAKRFLSQQKVPFVEKDIEASRAAAEELAAKAAQAGVQPGGVPVIDVAGTLLLGLDEPTLLRTLKEKGF